MAAKPVSKLILQNFPSSLSWLHREKEGKRSEQGAGSPQNFLELKVWGLMEAFLDLVP